MNKLKLIWYTVLYSIFGNIKDSYKIQLENTLVNREKEPDPGYSKNNLIGNKIIDKDNIKKILVYMISNADLFSEHRGFSFTHNEILIYNDIFVNKNDIVTMRYISETFSLKIDGIYKLLMRLANENIEKNKSKYQDNIEDYILDVLNIKKEYKRNIIFSDVLDNG